MFVDVLYLEVTCNLPKNSSNKMKCLLILIFALFASARAQGNTLVLLDNQVIKETHSIFFKSLLGKYPTAGTSFENHLGAFKTNLNVYF